MTNTPSSTPLTITTTSDDSPEAPALWRIDEVTRRRARAGIALARAALRASLERRAPLPDLVGADVGVPDGSVPRHRHEQAA